MNNYDFLDDIENELDRLTRLALGCPSEESAEKIMAWREERIEELMAILNRLINYPEEGQS